MGTHRGFSPRTLKANSHIPCRAPAVFHSAVSFVKVRVVAINTELLALQFNGMVCF
jgi:hypothetical protein